MGSDHVPPLERKPKLVIEFDDDEALPATTATPPAGRRVIVPDAAPPLAAQPPAPPTAAVGPPVRGLPADGGAPRAQPGAWVCAVREVIDAEHDDEDSLMLPVPGLTPDAVIMEERDGRDVRRVLANEIELRPGERNKHIIRAAEIRAQVQITDARLTVACSKYDKGGGWVGGPVAMIALNAGSKLLAARRRRGRMLVGQVRYPWIHGVYAQNKGGWTGAEMLRVIVKADGQLVRLDLTFPKDVDATAVATELIHRAARFRLAHDPELGEKERAALQTLGAIAPLVWRKEAKQMVGVEFPSFWPIGERSACFGLPGTVV